MRLWSALNGFAVKVKATGYKKKIEARIEWVICSKLILWGEMNVIRRGSAGMLFRMLFAVAGHVPAK